MFHLIRTIIWLTGIIVATSFALEFFHYKIRWDQVRALGTSCIAKAVTCRETSSNWGWENARCTLQCWTNDSLLKKVN